MSKHSPLRRLGPYGPNFLHWAQNVYRKHFLQRDYENPTGDFDFEPGLPVPLSPIAVPKGKQAFLEWFANTTAES